MFISKALCIGLTQTRPCGYLPKENERLSVLLEPQLHSTSGYNEMIQIGFRRSGETLYRPQCPECHACESIRINVREFNPNRNQKRVLKQLNSLTFSLKDKLDDSWFSLYDAYIAKRHKNGSMYPADKARFLSFIQTSWQKTKYLHIYQNEELISIAVTDILHDGWSAMYSFFAPDHPWSLGTLSVLAQIKLAQLAQVPWLYLGFQIDSCKAMQYKQNFKPNQRLINEIWHDQ